MHADIPGLMALAPHEARAAEGGSLYGAVYNAGYAAGAITSALLALYMAGYFSD